MQSFYSTYNVTKECGISTRQLYYWELTGLLQPHYESFGTRKFRRYTSTHIEILKKIKMLLDHGFTLQAVRDQISEPVEIQDGAA